MTPRAVIPITHASRTSNGSTRPDVVMVAPELTSLVHIVAGHPRGGPAWKERGSATEAQDLQLPVGMNQSVVHYFTSHGVRVMLSIGGITYVDHWNTALAQNATQLGLNAAAVAKQLGVGIEIDYANAMVPTRQPSTSGAESNWQEHVDGKSNYSPAIPPLAPAKFTGSLYITAGKQPLPECIDFASSLEKSTGPFVQSVAPAGAGSTSGMLGYMFWAAERPSTRNIGTKPPNTCEGGVGVGSSTYAVPVPMPALRQS